MKRKKKKREAKKVKKSKNTKKSKVTTKKSIKVSDEKKNKIVEQSEKLLDELLPAEELEEVEQEIPLVEEWEEEEGLDEGIEGETDEHLYEGEREEI